MRKLAKILFILAICLCASKLPAYGQPSPPITPSDLRRIVTCVRDELCAKWEEWKQDKEKGWTRVKFEFNNKKFKLAVPLDESYKGGFLSIWVFPSNGHAFDGFNVVDRGFNGTVDSGISLSGPNRDFVDLPGQKKTGLDTRGYWQQKFNSAVAEVLDFLKQ